MKPENETEFRAFLDHLAHYEESVLPGRFKDLAQNVIVPTLEEMAQRIRAAGHNCRVDAFLEEPLPERGQSVYLTLDTRYEPGEKSLCLRLAPGESIVRIETPAAGAVRTHQIPLGDLGAGNVELVAIEYLKRALL